MAKIDPPPIYEPISGSDGKASLPWILFFNRIFTGDTGTSWTPTFTNLTITGTPTITGVYYKIGPLCFFRITITPATDTSATAGSTYVNNFPLTMSAPGFCIPVSGLLGGGTGMCDAATNRIYPPSWSAVTVPLYILGLVEAS